MSTDNLQPLPIGKFPGMKKFHRTKTMQLLQTNTYDNMRRNTSILLVFYLIQMLDCQDILEIGFYQGQTFGAMLEACRKGNLTGIDIELRREIYDQHFHNGPMTKNKNINLIEIDIDDFEPQNSVKYDFVNIDACDDRYKLMMRVVEWMKPNGIMMVDNFDARMDDIYKFCLQMHNHGFIPFLTDDQALYFHHIDFNVADLLDYGISQRFFGHLDTIDVKLERWAVRRIVDMPKTIVLNGHPLFGSYCQVYNL